MAYKVEMCYVVPELVTNLFNDYDKIVSESKFQATEDTWCPCMLVLCPLDLACVAREIYDSTLLKILTPKQVLQRLPIALAPVNAGNKSDNLLK